MRAAGAAGAGPDEKWEANMYTVQMLSQIAEARSIANRVDHELREGRRLSALLEAACAAIATETASAMRHQAESVADGEFRA